MTAPVAVDVLSLLDALCAQTRQRGGSPPCKNIADAYAAVAELIEAAASYMQAEEALANREINGINAEPYGRLQARVHAARRDLDDALARCGGAQ